MSGLGMVMASVACLLCSCCASDITCVQILLPNAALLVLVLLLSCYVKPSWSLLCLNECWVYTIYFDFLSYTYLLSSPLKKFNMNYVVLVPHCALCLACFVLLCTQCEGESGTCPPGLFLCDGDRCLPTTWRCDWELDCSDMTDELDCSECFLCGVCLVTHFCS